MPGDKSEGAVRADAIVRLLTCGSVDDGKSTLLGRLLFDSGAVLDDHLAAARQATRPGTAGDLDLALLVDGLRAEREQGITIDLAHRHLFTAARRFLLLDAPGHEAYTRNMATGASLADVALLLVDAVRGVRTQTRRHLAILATLGVPTLIIAINKMDLVGYRADRFAALCDELEGACARLGLVPRCVPVCAITGANVVQRGSAMPWYGGPTLLELLDASEPAPLAEHAALRLPVQAAVRAGDARWLLGTIAAGTIEPGSEVTAWPAGTRGRVAAVRRFDGGPRGAAGDAVAVRLDGDLDVGRGAVLVPGGALSIARARITADVLWFAEEPLVPDRWYVCKLGTATTRARATGTFARFDVDALAHAPAQALHENDLGRVELELAEPVACGPYVACRAIGSFLLIHPETCATAGAGTVVGIEPQDGAGGGAVRYACRRAGVLGVPGEGPAARDGARVLAAELTARGVAASLVDVDALAVRAAWADVGRALAGAGIVAVVVGAPTSDEKAFAAALAPAPALVVAPADPGLFDRLVAAGWITAAG